MPGNGVRALHFQLLPSAQGRRRDAAAWVVAISAFLVLSLSAAPANAACAPDPAFSSGQTVTCSGNDSDGFQAGALNNLTLNVLAGATVNGSVSAAIGLNDANTVTNWGTVTAGLGLTGIEVGSFNNVTNSATITVGNSGLGISGFQFQQDRQQWGHHGRFKRHRDLARE